MAQWPCRALPGWAFSTDSPEQPGPERQSSCGLDRGGQQLSASPAAFSTLCLRKMISFIKYNILYIQPTVQLVWGWFSFYLFPSNLCKII